MIIFTNRCNVICAYEYSKYNVVCEALIHLYVIDYFLIKYIALVRAFGAIVESFPSFTLQVFCTIGSFTLQVFQQVLLTIHMLKDKVMLFSDFVFLFFLFITFSF
ncbi:hypothetical protein S83_023631 [Arachis hypogaea]